MYVFSESPVVEGTRSVPVLDLKHAGQKQGREVQNSTHASVATGCYEINFSLHRFFGEEFGVFHRTTAPRSLVSLRFAHLLTEDCL